MTKTTIVIAVELDEHTDCPAGSVALLGRRPRGFHGWLGLAESITTLVRDGDVELRSEPPSRVNGTQGERT